jgi:hypothetical protein
MVRQNMRNRRRGRARGGSNRKSGTLHRTFRSKAGKRELGDFAVDLNPPAFPPSVPVQILEEKIIEIEKAIAITTGAVAVAVSQAELRAAVASLLNGSTAPFDAVIESISYWMASADISVSLSEYVTNKIQMRSGRMFRPARGGFEWPKNKRLMLHSADTSTAKLVEVTASAAAAITSRVLFHIKVKIQPYAKQLPGPTLRFISALSAAQSQRSEPLPAIEDMSMNSPSSFTVIDDACSLASCSVSVPHTHQLRR